MAITIRPFSAEDVEAFLQVHHAAVRETAAGAYPAEVIEAWAPLPLADLVERVKADTTGIRLIAEADGEIAGIGEVVPERGELKACYVSPRHGAKGVGRALVAELEAIARSHGISSLQLSASLNAERFYQRLGYTAVCEGEHELPTGARMACIKMTKAL